MRTTGKSSQSEKAKKSSAKKTQSAKKGASGESIANRPAKTSRKPDASAKRAKSPGGSSVRSGSTAGKGVSVRPASSAVPATVSVRPAAAVAPSTQLLSKLRKIVSAYEDEKELDDYDSQAVKEFRYDWLSSHLDVDNPPDAMKNPVDGLDYTLRPFSTVYEGTPLGDLLEEMHDARTAMLEFCSEPRFKLTLLQYKGLEKAVRDRYIAPSPRVDDAKDDDADAKSSKSVGKASELSPHPSRAASEASIHTKGSETDSKLIEILQTQSKLLEQLATKGESDGRKQKFTLPDPPTWNGQDGSWEDYEQKVKTFLHLTRMADQDVIGTKLLEGLPAAIQKNVNAEIPDPANRTAETVLAIAGRQPRRTAKARMHKKASDWTNYRRGDHSLSAFLLGFRTRLCEVEMFRTVSDEEKWMTLLEAAELDLELKAGYLEEIDALDADDNPYTWLLGKLESRTQVQAGKRPKTVLAATSESQNGQPTAKSEKKLRAKLEKQLRELTARVTLLTSADSTGVQSSNRVWKPSNPAQTQKEKCATCNHPAHKVADCWQEHPELAPEGKRQYFEKRKLEKFRYPDNYQPKGKGKGGKGKGKAAAYLVLGSTEHGKLSQTSDESEFVNCSQKAVSVWPATSADGAAVSVWPAADTAPRSQLGRHPGFVVVDTGFSGSWLCGSEWLENFEKVVKVDSGVDIVDVQPSSVQYVFGNGTDCAEVTRTVQIPVYTPQGTVIALFDVIPGSLPALMGRTAIKEAKVAIDVSIPALIETSTQSVHACEFSVHGTSDLILWNILGSVEDKNTVADSDDNAHNNYTYNNNTHKNNTDINAYSSACGACVSVNCVVSSSTNKNKVVDDTDKVDDRDTTVVTQSFVKVGCKGDFVGNPHVYSQKKSRA